MSPRPLSTAASLAALAVAASLVLGGCSLLPRIPVLNNGSSSDNSNSDGNTDGQTEIEENPFLDNVVPEGFPSEVPLPDDLEIYLGLRSTEDSWTIIYIAEDLELDFNIAVEKFEAAGYTVVMNNQSSESALGVFEQAPYTVQVMGLAEGSDDFDGPSLSFTVVRATSELEEKP